MGRERRSGERLFYWSKLRDGVGVLRLRSRVGFAAAAASLRMTGVRLRMTGLAMIVLVSLGLACAQAWATGPALTTITDIVYRADGQTASGTVLISWPAFRTTEAIANREIVDEVKFKDGLGKIVDGTVECLNASIWARKQG